MIIQNEAHQLLRDLDSSRQPCSGSLLRAKFRLESRGGPESLLFHHVEKNTTDVDKAQYPVAKMATESYFVDWFRERLRRKGWSQADFHGHSGVPRATVSAWYRGDREPDPASVRIIADTLDADLLGAYRALGWLDEPTADSPMQADLISAIRRRNIEDKTARVLMATLDQLEPAEDIKKK